MVFEKSVKKRRTPGIFEEIFRRASPWLHGWPWTRTAKSWTRRWFLACRRPNFRPCCCPSHWSSSVPSVPSRWPSCWTCASFSSRRLWSHPAPSASTASSTPSVFASPSRPATPFSRAALRVRRRLSGFRTRSSFADSLAEGLDLTGRRWFCDRWLKNLIFSFSPIFWKN